ncbi:MAG: phosphatidylglycerophosphatase A [Candidatus Omnitrophota bacterium]|jgi:phosphatidylglycerophosphatase A
MVKFSVKLLSTFFYIGYLPLIPGTFGSLAGVVLFFLVKITALNYTLFTLAIIVLGFLVCGQAEKAAQKKDPSCVVIDEVSGMLLSFLFIPYDIKLVIIAFILFRILDMLKPYPAGRLERLKGSVGIMSDDLIAGLYTNLILQVVIRVTSFKVSQSISGVIF